MTRRSLAGLLLTLLLVAGCAGRPAPSTSPQARASAEPHERGVASWYGKKFHGRRTASGERYDMHALTAAHPSLPFGVWVEVVHQQTGRSVVVRINDRGPFVEGRVIDLSYAAARALGMVDSGLARVAIYLLD